MFKIRHIGIVTSDDRIEEMLDFYSVFGFKLFKQECESEKTMKKYVGLNLSVETYKLLTDNDYIIELLVFPKSIVMKKEANSRSITHIAFTVDNLSQVIKKVKSGHGFMLSEKIYRRDKNSPRVAFCRDPDGNILELVEDNE